LGYTQNKDIMMNLAKSVPLSYIQRNLRPDKSGVCLTESILFTVSGLLNNKDDDYVSSLRSNWSELKIKYDGETFEEADWNFFRLRPSNFPTLRIAAGARLAVRILNENFINSILDGFKREMFPDERRSYLTNILLIPAEDYWAGHYVFGKEAAQKNKYLLGASRADEIILNVLIPFTALYAKIFNMKDTYKNAIKFYIESQLIEKNRTVDNMLISLNMRDIKLRGIETQGILELKKTRCNHGNCSECYIGKNIASSVPSFSL
ncbi:MAG TPA: DUF2851 family protein, partial [Ignavibacteriales bacterium]|nr:DUF2851 family protein [Ignavibacteriales bacterium]